MIQKVMLRLSLVLVVLATLLGTMVKPASAFGVMTIRVGAVEPGGRVFLTFNNLTPGVEFTVRMKAYSEPWVGPVVAHISSSDGEVVSGWFEIVPELAHRPWIVVHIDDSFGYSASVIFDNSYRFQAPGSPDAAPVTAAAQVVSPRGEPTIEVTHVERGGIVAVKITQLPANTSFKVTVGKAGTQGIDGGLVARLDTGSTPWQQMFGQFEIPTTLSSEKTLDLRLEAFGFPGYVYVVSFKNENQ
jgi:hypothetical protein